MDHQQVTVELSKLRLNTENDRHGPLDSQRDCIMWMLEHLGNEIYNLARDIAEQGLSPLDNILVLPAEDSQDEYVVWEGNRRVTALKLLEEPGRCEDPNLVRRFRALSERANLPTKLTCIVAESVEDADRLIALRHQGPQEGVGTVPWTGAQKNRHLARMGKRGRYAYTQDVLDSIEPKLDEELRGQVQSPSFALSTLDRLLQNAEVREFLGLADEDGRPRRTLHESETLKGLTKILRDIANKELKVRDVYTVARQREYLGTFSENEKPDTSKTLKDSVPLTPPTTTLAVSQPLAVVPAQVRSLPLSRERRKLIPPGASYRIRNPRLNAIYRELRKLDVHDFPNAAAVLFRVFLELTTELYLDRHEVPYHSHNDSLRNKAGKAVKHATEKGWLNKDTGRGITTKLNDPKSLIGSEAFNAYVHSEHYHPVYADLNVMWDNVKPFFDAILNNLD